MNSRGCSFVVWALAVSLVAALVSAVNLPPSFTSTPPTEAMVGKDYFYDANASDPEPNDQLTYWLGFPVEGMQLDSNNGVLTWTPKKVGAQPVTIWVTDGLSQVPQLFTINVSEGIDQPPIITSQPVRTAYVEQYYSYRVNATDPEGGKVYYALDKQPAPPKGMTIDEQTGLISWVPGNEYLNQSVFVSVIARDINGRSSVQPYYIDVKKWIPPVNKPPEVRGTPKTNATINEPYNYTIDAVDPENDPLTFSLVIGPPGIQLNSSTGVITWTPSKADLGPHNVQVNITDGYNNLTPPHLFAISVKEPPRPPPPLPDPFPPNVAPPVMCLFLPVMVLLLELALIVNGSRKK